MDAELEAEIRRNNPPAARIVGTAISPDGAQAVAVIVHAGQMDVDHYNRGSGRWELGMSSGGGDAAVVCFVGEAPPDATVARIHFDGTDRSVAIDDGWFCFAAWTIGERDDPELLGFDP